MELRDYKLTITREYIDRDLRNGKDRVKRVITDEDGEVIFKSLHEASDPSEDNDPVANLEKRLSLDDCTSSNHDSRRIQHESKIADLINRLNPRSKKESKAAYLIDKLNPQAKKMSELIKSLRCTAVLFLEDGIRITRTEDETVKKAEQLLISSEISAAATILEILLSCVEDR